MLFEFLVVRQALLDAVDATQGRGGSGGGGASAGSAGRGGGQSDGGSNAESGDDTMSRHRDGDDFKVGGEKGAAVE